MALVVLVFDLTGSGLGVAATAAFEIAPVLALGPIAGLVADRYPRRSVMVGTDIGPAAIAALLAALHGQVALADATAFGLAAGAELISPAASPSCPT